MAATQVSPIGILFPGELGRNLAKTLVADGFEVCTTADGRSAATRERALTTGGKVLGSVAEVVAQAGIVISLVPPAAARSAAEQFASAAKKLTRPPLFVDGNAISPMTVEEVAQVVRSAGASLTDLAVVGSARDVRHGCHFYLSGPDAQTIHDTLGHSLQCHVIGDRIGQASAFKMACSGITKGITALFFEMTQLGSSLGCLEELMHAYARVLPESTEMFNWVSPTFAIHAARRADEIAELVSTLKQMGLSATMAEAMQTTIAAIATVRFSDPKPQTAHDMVEALAQSKVLTQR